MTSPEHKSPATKDCPTKMGGRGGGKAVGDMKERNCMHVEHSTLNKLSCEVTAVFFHKENYNLKRRCEAISSA